MGFSSFDPELCQLGGGADMAEMKVFLTHFNKAVFAFEFACVWQRTNWFPESSIKAFGTV